MTDYRVENTQVISPVLHETVTRIQMIFYLILFILFSNSKTHFCWCTFLWYFNMYKLFNRDHGEDADMCRLPKELPQAVSCVLTLLTPNPQQTMICFLSFFFFFLQRGRTFPECYINEIIQYVTFWVLWLSITLRRVIQVLVCISLFLSIGT